MRRIVLVICLGACAALRPAAIRAEPAPALATEAARAHYDAGRVYYEQGEVRRAIAEFLAGQRDDDQPAFDYNLGVCYGKLDDAVHASAAYRRFLSRKPDAPNRTEVEAQIAAFEQRIGELVITSRTPGARLAIDGEPAEPARPLRVNAGLHRVVAGKDGYLSCELDVTVIGGGRAALEIEPRQPPAMPRRRALAIGLGVAGAAVVVGVAITLGVVLGARSSFDAHKTDLGTIIVRP